MTAPARSAVTIVGAPRQRLFAHLAMLLFAALIAGSFTGGALILPHLGPLPSNAARFILAAALLGLYVFGLARHPLVFPRAPWRYLVMGFLLAIYFVTMFFALEIAEPVATSAVYTLVPLLTAVTAYFLVGQRSGPVVLLSLFVAGLGALWVIFRGDIEALLGLDIGRGELIYFVGCLSYAFYTPLLRRYARGEPAMVQSFWTLSASALWIVLWGLPELPSVDWTGLPALVWWVLLYLAVFPTAVCFFLIQFASHHLPAAKVVAYGYLVPAFVILLEGLLGHGWTTPGVAAGALVTVLGLLVLAAQKER